MKLSIASPVVVLVGPPVARSVSAVVALRPIALVPPAPVEVLPRRVTGSSAPRASRRGRPSLTA